MAGLADVLCEHRHVGIDTPVFIYQFEADTPVAVAAGIALDELAAGRFLGVTSPITLMEILVQPLRMARQEVADTYELLLLRFPNLRVQTIDAATARVAAELRARHRIRPADALQIAASLQAGATAFLTNDHELRRVNELQVILLDDFVR